MCGTVEEKHLIQVHSRIWTAADFLDWTPNCHWLSNPSLDVSQRIATVACPLLKQFLTPLNIPFQKGPCENSDISNSAIASKYAILCNNMQQLLQNRWTYGWTYVKHREAVNAKWLSSAAVLFSIFSTCKTLTRGTGHQSDGSLACRCRTSDLVKSHSTFHGSKLQKKDRDL